MSLGINTDQVPKSTPIYIYSNQKLEGQQAKVLNTFIYPAMAAAAATGKFVDIRKIMWMAGQINLTTYKGKIVPIFNNNKYLINSLKYT